MQVIPVSQQAAVQFQNTQPVITSARNQAEKSTSASQNVRSDAKPTAQHVAQQAVAKADTVTLSERVKDLAAQQAGKGASEELRESGGAKEIEARY